MTQESIFWPTSAIGDGISTGYSSDQWQWFNRMTWLNDPTTQGVALGYLNSLEVTNPAGVTLRVATGGAIVYGFPYRNTADLDFGLTTPIIGPTGWRLVLRADWETQTVRADVLQSADGVAAIPAVTQSAGVTWEITLATGTITVVPVVAITDGRVFCEAGIEIDHGHLASRTRTVFVPAVYVDDATAGDLSTRSGPSGWHMDDPAVVSGWSDWQIPTDFVSGMTIVSVIWVGSGDSGDLWGRTGVDYGAVGESYFQHSDTGPLAAHPCPVGNRIYEIDPRTLTVPTIGDYVSLGFIRDSTNPADTIDAIISFKGWQITYTADM